MKPSARRLRVYAFDPSLDTQLETAMINQVVIDVPWEPLDGGSDLTPGPTGEYLEVVDVDPASRCMYAPVNLNDPNLLAQDGLAASEGNPQFHQQMVYAVAMVTIRHFEKALGRKVLWSNRYPRQGKAVREQFVSQLRIYPHAIREANAYYDPAKKALLFGYFPASGDDPGRHLPGGTVFTCLSHDIIAHETTHAIVDGIHRRYQEASNPDVLAFHEAFSDIVALFQHFSFKDVLANQIAKTRGNLADQSLLGELAQQFGRAIGKYGALRDAIGWRDSKTKEWRRSEPDPNAINEISEPHGRGSLLVAAVFDAFLAIYGQRTADLIRIATQGSGVLPPGEIHPDLVARLAEEASKTAKHILHICIRALDYCPPVDITFGEFLRAIITADSDLVPDDPHGYRIAFIESFRRRGIYPRDVRTLSVDSLRWRSPDSDTVVPFKEMLGTADMWKRPENRKAIHEDARNKQRALHEALVGGKLPAGVSVDTKTWNELAAEVRSKFGIKDGYSAPEVHSVRPARRIGPNGQETTDLVIVVTQHREVPIDDKQPRAGTFRFWGGCTVIADLESGRIRYVIRKNIDSRRRLERQREVIDSRRDGSLRATYFADAIDSGFFADLHRNGDAL